MNNYAAESRKGKKNVIMNAAICMLTTMISGTSNKQFANYMTSLRGMRNR
jgi:hypothetical protein